MSLLGGAAAVWPLAARAQQHPPMGVPLSGARQPVIGFLNDLLAAELLGLAKMRYRQGDVLLVREAA